MTHQNNQEDLTHYLAIALWGKTIPHNADELARTIVSIIGKDWVFARKPKPNSPAPLGAAYVPVVPTIAPQGHPVAPASYAGTPDGTNWRWRWGRGGSDWIRRIMCAASKGQ